jgi:hypothetical protein
VLTFDTKDGNGTTIMDLKTKTGFGGLDGNIEVMGLLLFVLLYKNLEKFQ